MNKNNFQSPLPHKNNKKKLLSFFEALRVVASEKGVAIRRDEWPEGERGYLQADLLHIDRNNEPHTWIISEGDLLAVDWVIIKK